MTDAPNDMSAPLAARHALVCGASAGIGRATALALAKQGATVTVLARRQDRLTALVGKIRAQGGQAHALAVDLDQRDAAVAAVSAHVAAVGPVHILINNAGGPPSGPILAASESGFELAFGRHVLAAHRLVQLLVPGMAEAGYGRIINVVSTSVREPIDNLGVSNTTRGAVASWAKSLSRELPPGVTINNVLPGFTDTERLETLASNISTQKGCSTDEVRTNWLSMVPEGRLIRPEETAATIAFLASAEAGAIRGVSLAVDGGRMRSI